MGILHFGKEYAERTVAWMRATPIDLHPSFTPDLSTVPPCCSGRPCGFPTEREFAEKRWANRDKPREDMSDEGRQRFLLAFYGPLGAPMWSWGGGDRCEP